MAGTLLPRPFIARGISEAHPRNAAIRRDISKRDRNRAAVVSQNMKMKVRREAPSHVTTARNRLPLLHPFSDADEAASLLQMCLFSHRPICVKDGDLVVWRLQASSVMADLHMDDDTAARRANLGTNGHAEIVGELLPTAVTHNSAVALAAKPGFSRRPR